MNPILCITLIYLLAFTNEKKNACKKHFHVKRSQLGLKIHLLSSQNKSFSLVAFSYGSRLAGYSVQQCRGFSWDSVEFLHSSRFVVVFWIFGESNITNTRMF